MPGSADEFTQSAHAWLRVGHDRAYVKGTCSKVLKKQRSAFSTISSTVIGASLLVFAAQQPVSGAEFTLLCDADLQPAMQELIPEFESTSGHRVKVSFITERPRDDEPADLVIASPRRWSTPTAQRDFVARVGIGIAVRKGAAKPDIGLVAAFKRTLLEARNIAVRAPAHDDWPPGADMMRLFDRLGIKIELEPKLTLVRTPAAVTEQVAGGNSEIGLTYVNVIVADPGVDFAGPLPAELWHETLMIFTAERPRLPRKRTAVDAFVDSCALRKRPRFSDQKAWSRIERHHRQRRLNSATASELP